MTSLDGVKVGFAFGVQQAIHDLLAAVRGQVDRQAFSAEGVLNPADDRFQIDVGHVNLVDDDRPREVALASGLENAPGDDFHTRLGVDDDRDRLHRRQARQRRADQVRRAGNVNQVDPLARVVQMKDRAVDRMAVLFFFLFKVGESCCRRRTEALRLTAPAANSMASARVVLPLPSVAGDENVADVRGGITGHLKKLLTDGPDRCPVTTLMRQWRKNGTAIVRMQKGRARIVLGRIRTVRGWWGKDKGLTWPESGQLFAYTAISGMHYSSCSCRFWRCFRAAGS